MKKWVLVDFGNIRRVFPWITSRVSVSKSIKDGQTPVFQMLSPHGNRNLKSNNQEISDHEKITESSHGLEGNMSPHTSGIPDCGVKH